LKHGNTLWAVSADLKDMSGTVTMTKAETDLVTAQLSRAGTLFRQVPGSFFDTLKDNDKLNIIVNSFNNTFYRNKTSQPKPTAKVKDLMNYIKSKQSADVNKLSTDAAKQRKTAEYAAIMNLIDANNMAKVFEMQQLLSDAKLIIINKLDNLNMTKTFVKTSNGYKVTKAEGFVAIDTIAGGAVKLVDRLEFSTNNFDPDVVKGWQSATRR